MRVILKKFLVLTLVVIILITSSTNSIVQAATTGSKSSPYSLSLGTSKTVTIPKKSNMWFKFNAKGDIDITVKSTNPNDISIYKKGLLSNKQIGYTTTTSSFKKVYHLYNNSTYLISVNNFLSSSYSITVKAAYHTQSTNWANGGTWEPDSDSAVPYSVICLGKYYIPKNAVAELYQAMNEDAYLNIVDRASTMALSAALAYLEPKLGITTLTASMIYSACTSNISFSLVGFSLNSIKSAGGYNSSTKKYTKGVCFSIFLTAEGNKFYTYNSWTDGIMYGQEGYSGKFTCNAR